MNPNTVKIIDSGRVPEYLIYEHDEGLLIFKISKNHFIKHDDPQYSLYQTLPYKVIDGRTLK